LMEENDRIASMPLQRDWTGSAFVACGKQK
jgi:hypothetical protein